MKNHVIMTRFNLRLVDNKTGVQSPNTNLQKCPWLDVEYLKYRFEIFERYTFNSFLHQTSSHFQWLVFFHKDTPREFLDKIAEFQVRMKQFVPVFLDDKECDNWCAYVSHYLLEHYPAGSIITTRVDNDDCVHETFVEMIQKDMCDINTKTFLTYPKGLQYDCVNKLIVKYHYVNNHFLSLYTLAADDHILLYDHSLIDETIKKEKSAKMERYIEYPMWVEVITGTNWINRVQWRFRNVYIPYSFAFLPLEMPWSNRHEWLKCMLDGIMKSFCYYINRIFVRGK